MYFYAKSNIPMRQLISLLLLLFVVNSINAQYYDDSPQLVFSLDGATPLNQPAKTYNGVGVGGSAKIAFPIGEFSDFVIAGSLMTFSGKNYVDAYKLNRKAAKRNIAVAMVGYRYYLSPLFYYNTWYIEPRIGLTADGTKHQAVTFGGALGYLINNKVDLTLRYQAFGGQYNNSMSFISFGVGYGFSLK